jgi:hypothetical protein
MLTPYSGIKPGRPSNNPGRIFLLVCVTLFGVTGCSYLCEPTQESRQNTVVNGGGTQYLDPQPAPAKVAAVAPVAIPTTGSYPLDTNGEQPSYTIVDQPIAQASVTYTTPQTTAQPSDAHTNPASSSQKQAACPDPVNNHYKKSVAFVSFPRTVPVTSSLGALHQVEQQLPLLIGTNLTSRHAVLAPIYLRGGFISTNIRGEADSAVQVQILSHQHRVQFFVSGEVDDMTLTFPDSVENPSYYTRFVNGTHNLLHINTPLDKRSRAFGFKVEVRDGFTGQIVFTNHYRTVGKWKPAPEANVGFGSSRFWETDYGEQIQHLVAKASDDLANAINCQPYVARIESSPGQRQVVIQSGSNSGMHRGDTLDLYQLIHQPISGEYQRFDTRLVKRNGYIHLTETYPSHSVGNVVDETLLGGQYLIKVR